MHFKTCVTSLCACALRHTWRQYTWLYTLQSAARTLSGPDHTERVFCSERRLFWIVFCWQWAFCTLFMRPGHLAFSPPAAPRVFAGALWAPEVEKKATLSRKAPHVIAFFSIIQSNERRGGPSVVVMKVYRCLESPETAIMDEKLVVSVTGFTRSCIF